MNELVLLFSDVIIMAVMKVLMLIVVMVKELSSEDSERRGGGQRREKDKNSKSGLFPSLSFSVYLSVQLSPPPHPLLLIVSQNRGRMV